MGAYLSVAGAAKSRVRAAMWIGWSCSYHYARPPRRRPTGSASWEGEKQGPQAVEPSRGSSGGCLRRSSHGSRFKGPHAGDGRVPVGTRRELSLHACPSPNLAAGRRLAFWRSIALQIRRGRCRANLSDCPCRQLAPAPASGSSKRRISWHESWPPVFVDVGPTSCLASRTCLFIPLRRPGTSVLWT